jgi:hypothetical protein
MSFKKRKLGDVRECDGKVFIRYKNLKRSDGTSYVYEEWATREVFNRSKKTQKLWRLKNREKLKEKAKKYYSNPKTKEKRKKYFSDPIIQEKTKKWMKEYYGKKEIKDRIAKYMREKRKNNPQFIIKERLRHRIWMSLNRINKKKSTKTIELIGCSYDFLKNHIEKQFKVGMAWNKPNSFHIDHIRPLASFDLADPKQLKLACHWTNIQPLTPTENKRKSAKCIVS